jgi:hypothetical protein
MFWVRSRSWVGSVDISTARPEQFGTEYWITRTAPHGNSRPYPFIHQGWLGTSNDWAHYADGGPFADLAEAEERLRQIFRGNGEEIGDLNRALLDESSWWEDSSGPVPTYGDVERLRFHCYAGDWLSAVSEELRARLAAGAEVEALASELEGEALSVVDHDIPAGVRLYGTVEFLRSL